MSFNKGLTLGEIPYTWICQLGKPENLAMLEGYRARRDKSPEELARLYFDVINALKDTPCWGVAGVNKMINTLTASVEATLTKKKTGKTSAYAQARILLDKIDFNKNLKAVPKYNKCSLDKLLTEADVKQLLLNI